MTPTGEQRRGTPDVESRRAHHLRVRAAAEARSRANAEMCGYAWDVWMTFTRQRRKSLTQQRKKELRDQEAP